jgi:hypothetical protein
MKSMPIAFAAAALAAAVCVSAAFVPAAVR